MRSTDFFLVRSFDDKITRYTNVKKIADMYNCHPTTIYKRLAFYNNKNKSFFGGDILYRMREEDDFTPDSKCKFCLYGIEAGKMFCRKCVNKRIMSISPSLEEDKV